jgi:hypothetical protein
MMKNTRVDVSDCEVPVRISVAMEEVNDLIKGKVKMREYMLLKEQVK